MGRGGISWWWCGCDSFGYTDNDDDNDDDGAAVNKS